MKRSLSLSLFGIFVTSTAIQAQTVDLDGVLGAPDSYSNSEVVTWWNGHKSEESIYGEFDSQFYTTTIRYGIGELAGGTPGEQFFFLYVEAPLYAKNMIWQSDDTANWKDGPLTNTDPSLGLTEADVFSYRTHHETHHSPFDMKLDFSGATGSEKMILVDSGGGGKFEADLADKADSKYGLLGYSDSSFYLLDNGLATEELSLNRDTPMSFEFQFEVDAQKNDEVVALARNGIEFHLSPERGLIPEPGSAVLFCLAGTLLFLRRRR